MDHNYNEENVTIDSAFPLKGTLTIPESNQERFPALLFISDSGEVNRDANTKEIPSDIFRDLAAAISESGFVTLRYDKRGIGESGGNFYETGLTDLVDDTESALVFLKNHPRVIPNQLFLLGYGEGAILSPLLNARSNVQGIILLAGITGSYWEVLKRKKDLTLREIRELKGVKGLLCQLLKVADRLNNNFIKINKLVLESEDLVVKYDGNKLNAKWMRDHFSFNALKTWRKVTCNVLAIAGSKDIQTPPREVEMITRVVENAEYHLIKDLNHILRKDSQQPAMLTLTKDYKRLIKRPIDAELINIINSWLEKHKS